MRMLHHNLCQNPICRESAKSRFMNLHAYKLCILLAVLHCTCKLLKTSVQNVKFCFIVTDIMQESTSVTYNMNHGTQTVE